MPARKQKSSGLERPGSIKEKPGKLALNITDAQTSFSGLKISATFNVRYPTVLSVFPFYRVLSSLGSCKRVFLTRILIADDRELMRSALKAIFALRPHWQVCGEASDGAEVVAMASQLQPDLIILDFKMPLADGIRAASEILIAMPSIPIVMYTLYKTDELESAAKLVGVRAVVAKEHGVRNLLSAVDAELTAKQ